jgi:hypothetical protein
MSQSSSQKPIHRIITIVSAVAFAGSTVFGLAGLFSGASNRKKNSTMTATASKDAQLKKQEQGYELVLHREPKNQLALQELVPTRLQMNDL